MDAATTMSAIKQDDFFSSAMIRARSELRRPASKITAKEDSRFFTRARLADDDTDDC